MYAVIQTGGKQYTVAKNDVITVNKLDAKAGDKLTIKEVLLVSGDKSPKFGAPFVAGASVIAEVVEQTRADTVIIFKKKRRHNYRRKNGHRQPLTTIKISDIKVSSSKEDKE